MAASNLSNEQKIWGAISYLWILSLVALASRKDDSFVRFHASQGVLLLVIWAISLLTGPLIPIIGIIIGVTSIIGLIKAYQGEKWEIPVIGQYAKGLGDWIIKTIKL